MILPDLITHHAKSDPGRTALIFRDQPISYGELEDRVLRCTQGLVKIGVKKGDTFGLLLRNCPEFPVLCMALSKLGAVCVPINFMEKPDRIALILNDAQAVGLLTAKEFYRHAATAAKKVPTLKHIYLRDGEHRDAHHADALMKNDPWTGTPPTQEEDLMMLLYTSGTTGLPKGVMLSHANFLANVEQCLGAIRLHQKDRFLCLLPLFHSFSWTTCMLIPLKLGCTIVINESLMPFEPVIKAIWKHKITLFVAVPQIYSALTAKIQGAKAFVLRFLNPIRLCISGAAPLTPTVHRRFEKTFGVPLLEGYGLTEAAPVAALNPEKKRKTGTVGKPLPGVDIRIMTEEGKPAADGEIGEIFMRGKNIMKGYYRKAQESAEVLTADGWLRTGDMGRFDEDGYLSIVDRKKDLIIIKGLNVYPQEVEAVISQHPQVKEVAVVGKMDPESGDETIRAFITLKDARGLEKSEIFNLCRENLASYKRPKDVIVLDELPKNALQKILKKDLRNRP